MGNLLEMETSGGRSRLVAGMDGMGSGGVKGVENNKNWCNIGCRSVGSRRGGVPSLASVSCRCWLDLCC